ncbi:MAG: hypothetical protein LBI54_03330 [Lachnospiraceae bacterium]|nr:hypothetical protein [Lachnospiraceae bacterium]
MENQELRQLMKNNRVSQWQLAERLGFNEITICRHLRRELPADVKQEYIAAVEAIIAERESR